MSHQDRGIVRHRAVSSAPELGPLFLKADTVRTVADRHIEHGLPERRHSTRQSHSSGLNRWICPRWGDHLLNQARPVAVEEWLRSLPLAPKAKVNLPGLFHITYEHARRWEPTDCNPIDLVWRRGGAVDTTGLNRRGNPSASRATDGAVPHNGSGCRLYGAFAQAKSWVSSGATSIGTISPF